MASKETQEALEVVKSYLRTDNAYVVTVTGEAIKTLQKLVDKATPKKVFICDNDCSCPNCTTSLVDVRKDAYKQFINKYCTYCGQALDWSEENGK